MTTVIKLRCYIFYKFDLEDIYLHRKTSIILQAV